METEVEGGQGSGENPERGIMMQKWGKGAEFGTLSLRKSEKIIRFSLGEKTC